MDTLQKAAFSPNNCFISLFFSGEPKASALPNTDAFFTSILSPDHEADVYVTSGTIELNERSSESRSGVKYIQTLKFTLPTNDDLRASRLHQFKKVKFIAITLTNKKQLFFGRNDVKQNTKPKVSIASNEKLTTVQYQITSMVPAGFLLQETFAFQDGMKFLFQDGSSFNQ